MRKFAVFIPMFLGVTISYVAGAAEQQADPIKAFTSQQLYDVIAHEDSVLFGAVFDTCDLDTLGPLLADDFEFYHDKWGLIATSKRQFMENIKNQCERQKQGTDYRARRELVKDTLKVYPLHGYGAIETGVHKFYRLTVGKPDTLTETAKFFQVWKYLDGVWRLERVFSYDHQDPMTAAGGCCG